MVHDDDPSTSGIRPLIEEFLTEAPASPAERSPMKRWRVYLTESSIIPRDGAILSLDVELEAETQDEAESFLRMAIPGAGMEIRTVTEMAEPEDLGGFELDLAGVEALEPGPHGYHREPGFRIVKGDPEDSDGVRVLPVPAVLCASDKHPVPQWRYLSPLELSRGVLEVADKMICGRVRVEGQARSPLVIGRTDDIAEVLGHSGRGLLARLGGKLIRRLGGLIEGAVGALGGRLP